MDIRIKSSLYKEKELLTNLLDNLDKQYSALISTERDAVAICSISEKVDSIVKEIALTEIERRKIISNEDLISQIKFIGDEEYETLLKDISRLKKLIESQNEINSAFIKQNLFFTRKMLKMITPGEKYETYNSAGKIGKK